MDNLFRNKYRIPSARASWWDYRQNGYYFVTICTDNHKSFFGDVISESMELTEIGQIAYKCWSDIPQYYPFATLDVFIVMPNHVHGIIIIEKDQPPAFDPVNQFQPQSENLAAVVRGYKAGVTAKAKALNPDFRWQARFHDHIIRNDRSYMEIADYIIHNPARWENDKFHPNITT